MYEQFTVDAKHVLNTKRKPRPKCSMVTSSDASNHVTPVKGGLKDRGLLRKDSRQKLTDR
jgi:hypothetical protein